ncbi:MAG: hypothetical protein HC857_10370 [Synechococcales cyanobacterium RU_4_20]|nr:hypothetical protein [Synechococcales cyanobacterium RU_4_20]NJR70190.1 hypothetical protein [Synechococcales cyanobacterium CRU_2_2]
MAQLTLNLETGSVSVELPTAAVQELKATLDEMMVRLKAVAGAGKARSPQKPVEYRYKTEIFLELFCNPNIWPTPFAAKVLITLRDSHLRLSTEASLSQAIADVNLFLEQA